MSIFGSYSRYPLQSFMFLKKNIKGFSLLPIAIGTGLGHSFSKEFLSIKIKNPFQSAFLRSKSASSSFHLPQQITNTNNKHIIT